MDIIITGATGGIGSRIANHAVGSRKIERIYCIYRNEEKLNRWPYANHPKVFPIRHDAACQEEAVQLAQALDKTKPDDIAYVHTAFCIAPMKRAGTYLAEEVRENIAANVMDMVFLVNRLIAYKRASNKAQLRIINIDSGAAYKPLEGWGLYSAAKAYTNMFLESVQLENPDVKAVSYEPGVVDTRMQEEIRKTDSHVFGQVGLFREYYDNGTLRSPDAVAGDIFARFVEGWDGANFKERFR